VTQVLLIMTPLYFIYSSALSENPQAFSVCSIYKPGLLLDTTGSSAIQGLGIFYLIAIFNILLNKYYSDNSKRIQ